MEKPNVELEISRDENGFITKMAYKVNPTEDDKDGKRVVEFLEIISSMFDKQQESCEPMQLNITTYKGKK
jgi:hypothetical protein